MPQTRFVTQKAFAYGLRPLLVVNKIDRPGARPDQVVDWVFDLFVDLHASDAQLDFPIVYASALLGYATSDWEEKTDNMSVLLDAIIEHVPPPKVDPEGPFQMQVTSLDYSSYVGTIGIGRIARGSASTNMPVAVVDASGGVRQARILQVMHSLGLERQEVASAGAGDIVAVSGIEGLRISDTLCDPKAVEALPALKVDEPTISMVFQVNDSPFAGRDGNFVTSRKIRDRLYQETLHNVALRVEDTDTPDRFKVSGRGELHLAILIETMRREGYELAVAKPDVINKTVDGVLCEPYEILYLDIEERHQGALMEQLGLRRAEMRDMQADGSGRIRFDYYLPSRALIGFYSDFMTMTSGTGIAHQSFAGYAAISDYKPIRRIQGVLVANGMGESTAFALWNLQERGRLFIGPQVEVYEGMVVGLHNRDNDLVVNVSREKHLTNVRASGSDENIILTPPVVLSLEQAMGFIEDDELLEVTPHYLRLRKKYLKENERKRSGSKSA